MTKSTVEAMLKGEKEKTPVSVIFLDLKHPYPDEVTSKPYPNGYVTPRFKKFLRRRATWWTCRSLPWFYGSACQWSRLCLRKFSRSLTDRTYTLFVTLKIGSVHDWSIGVLAQHQIFLCQSQVYIGWNRKHTNFSERISTFMWNNFHKKALDCCDPIAEDSPVDVVSIEWLKIT